jgi:hypothetical protein
MIAKEKPASRAITTTAATPKERRTEQLSKSPCSVTEINLPMTRFDNVLEALCPSNSLTGNDLDNPCDPAPMTEKNNQITPHASPMSVGQQTIMVNSTINNTSTEVSPQACVRISETATTAEAKTTPIASSTSLRLILQSASKSTTQESNPSISDNEASQSKGHLKEIHNRTNMLFHVFSDNCMNLFMKCITALLGEILCVDDMAKIATILITNDESCYISSKADLPTNFTKLGQHVMICRGSWAFNKKEKGNNNVYTRFRLKSQVEIEEIINRVPFEFSCLSRKNLYKKQYPSNGDGNPMNATIYLQQDGSGKHSLTHKTDA